MGSYESGGGGGGGGDWVVQGEKFFSHLLQAPPTTLTATEGLTSASLLEAFELPGQGSVTFSSQMSVCMVN